MQNSKSDLQIALLFKEINSKLNHSIREEFKDTGLTVPQIHIIRILHNNERLKISEISKKMSLVNSTVSGIVDRLEKQELVKRVRSEKDKRIVFIELTNKANELVKELRQTIDNYFEGVFVNSSKEEIDTILDGLETLKKILDKS